jgi:hypothetical protein
LVWHVLINGFITFKHNIGNRGISIQRKFTVAILLMLILVVSIATYMYFQKLSGDSYDSSQNVINIIFKYGVGAKNELNTFNGTYTRDMVVDPSITIWMILSQEELRQIQQKIAEIDLFSFPDSFPLNPSRFVTPEVDYYIKVQNGTQVKEITWSDNSLMESNVQNSLDQLVNFLISMIQQKPEYKALPTPRSAYQ